MKSDLSSLANAQSRISSHVRAYVELCGVWPEIRYEHEGVQALIQISGPGPNSMLKLALESVFYDFEALNGAFPVLDYRPGEEHYCELRFEESDDDNTSDGGLHGRLLSKFPKGIIFGAGQDLRPAR